MQNRRKAVPREPRSFLSPKLGPLVCSEVVGRGIRAQESVRAGEVLAIWGGEVLGAAAFARLPEELRRHSLQIEEDTYLVPTQLEPVDFFNHCCEPNAGISGQIVLVALRDILPGEEVRYDYATTDGTPYDEFPCACGAARCRGRVTSDAWRNPELWARYKGFFSPYLQRRIDALRAAKRRLLPEPAAAYAELE